MLNVFKDETFISEKKKSILRRKKKDCNDIIITLIANKLIFSTHLTLIFRFSNSSRATCYGSYFVYRSSSSGTIIADGLKIKAKEKFEGMIRAFPPSKRCHCIRLCTYVRIRIYVDTVRLLQQWKLSTIPAGSAMGKNKEHNRLHPHGFPVRDRTSVSYQL